MAIAFRAAASSKRTTGGASLVMTLPAGRQAGDVAIAQLAFGDNITALAGLTGWTEFSWSPLAMGTGRVHYFWKVLDGTETDPTVTWTTNAKPIFEVACWSGVNNTTPFEAHNGAVDSVSNTDVASPTVNNTGDGTEWAVAFFTYRTSTAGDKTATYTPPAALTERADDNISAATSAPYLMCEAADSNGAVAAGNHQYTSDCTATTASTNKASALIYLNPAGGAISVTLGQLSATNTLLSLAASKSVVVAELVELDTQPAPTASKSATLGQLSATNTLLSLAASKAVALGELAATNTLLSLSAAKAATLGMLGELETLLGVAVGQAKSITLGLLAELDLLLSLAAAARGYHPRAGKVSVSSSATGAESTSRGRTTAAVGPAATDADVTPAGTDAIVSDGLTTADVS